MTHHQRRRGPDSAHHAIPHVDVKIEFRLIVYLTNKGNSMKVASDPSGKVHFTDVSLRIRSFLSRTPISFPSSATRVVSAEEIFAEIILARCYALSSCAPCAEFN